jgi:hypothetical protein
MFFAAFAAFPSNSLEGSGALFCRRVALVKPQPIGWLVAPRCFVALDVI